MGLSHMQLSQLLHAQKRRLDALNRLLLRQDRQHQKPLKEHGDPGVPLGLLEIPREIVRLFRKRQQFFTLSRSRFQDRIATMPRFLRYAPRLKRM
jgi:hypothetical protein